MASHYTASDAANHAVRAFLTKVGEHYLARGFNTGSGWGLRKWEEIRDVRFNCTCCYCGETKTQLTKEHLISMSREEYGLHHPGNIAPSCSACNLRKSVDGVYPDWKAHLRAICSSRGEQEEYQARYQRLQEHIKREQYPELSTEARQAIKVIADTLYSNTRQELERSTNLYRELDEAFVSVAA